MTVAVGRVNSVIRSSVRLARISCTTLTAMLSEMTPSETTASPARPTKIKASARTKITILMKVKTFSRTICAYVRGRAYLQAGQAKEAAQQFQNILAVRMFLPTAPEMVCSPQFRLKSMVRFSESESFIIRGAWLTRNRLLKMPFRKAA